MNVDELKNKIGAQLESLEAAVPEPIERFVSAPAAALKKLVPEKNAILRPGLVIGAAILGAVVLGSWLNTHRATAGLDAIGARVPGTRQRRWFRRRVSARRIGAAIGLVASSSFVLAAIEAAVGNRIMKNPAARGATTATMALAFERWLFGRSYARGLIKALGWKGTALKYAAIATAYALTSPKREEKRDPTGGDISAGVPAM